MLRKIINTFTSNVFIAILNLIIAIAVSQYLGAAGKGYQSILITTIAFVLLACNIAGGASLVYLTPRYNNYKLIFPAYTWTVLVCLIVFFILQIFDNIPHQYIIHICLLTLISSFTAINSMVLLGNEKIAAKNLVAVSQTFIVVISLLFLFMVLHKKDIESYITALYIGNVISFFISCIYLLRFVKRKNDDQNSFIELLKDMFKYGLLNQASHITQLLSIRLSYYILLLHFGEDQVGIYSNAVSLAEATWLVSKSVAAVQYARIANSTDNNYSKILTVKLLKATFFISFIIIVPMVLLPAKFYMTVFGDEFGDINMIITILAPGILIYNFSIILGHYFSGRGLYHYNTLASLIGLVVSATLYSIIIPRMGIFGAAISIVISFCIMSVFLFIIFIKKNQFSVKDILPGRKDFLEIKKILKENFKMSN